jgi:hypothetical protein
VALAFHFRRSWWWRLGVGSGRCLHKLLAFLPFVVKLLPVFRRQQPGCIRESSSPDLGWMANRPSVSLAVSTGCLIKIAKLHSRLAVERELWACIVKARGSWGSGLQLAISKSRVD